MRHTRRVPRGSCQRRLAEECDPISERIIYARIEYVAEQRGSEGRILLTSLKPNDFNKGKARDLIMVIGYLNQKVGSDDRNREAPMETHGEGVISENSEMFCDFCVPRGLGIGGTLFPHKKSHKLAWRTS